VKVKEFVPDPDTYVALRLVGVVARAKVGVPVTITASLIATTIVMTSPALYVPLVEVTPVTVGGVVSATAVIIAVRLEVPVVDVPPEVPTTIVPRYFPTSLLVTTYVSAVAPEISWQLLNSV
jgi:DUF917 family protein